MQTMSFAVRRRTAPWLGFAWQVTAVAALELGDDIFRGNIDPPNAAEAIQHARAVVSFEQAHGLFLEPAIQVSKRSTPFVGGRVAPLSDVAGSRRPVGSRYRQCRRLRESGSSEFGSCAHLDALI